jgi:hypothetical protein
LNGLAEGQHNYHECPPFIVNIMHPHLSTSTTPYADPTPQPLSLSTHLVSHQSPKSAKQPPLPAHRVAEPQLQLNIGSRVITIPLRHAFIRSFNDVPTETAASLVCHQTKQLSIRYNAVTRR